MAQRAYCNIPIEKEVAEELGLPLSTVKRIVNSQSAFVKDTIESGTFSSVRMAYLGTFKAKLKEVQMINHLKGMTPEQQAEFRKDVKSGRIKFNWWEKEQ